MLSRSHVVCAVAGLVLVVICGVQARVQVLTTWSTAAESNALLRTEMQWQFGGKDQRGWSIYVPLIASLLNLSNESDDRLFAMSVANWQKSQRIATTGVLENDTWMRMISYWQSRRLRDGNRGYPADDELVTISVDDLYDPGRPMELRQVEQRTYAAYKAMFAAASEDLKLARGSKFLKIVSAFRTREYQEQLRQQSPQAGRITLAVNSTHFSGRALDVYVGGDPVDSKDENRMIQTRTPAYRWMTKNAVRFGFQPYFYEPWHWEYTQQVIPVPSAQKK